MKTTLSFILTATLCASLAVRAEAGSEKTAFFGPLALTTTSSARLNVLAADNVQVELLFLDSSGNVVADSGTVSVAPGKGTSLTLAGTSLIYAPGALRAQVQARVKLLSPPGASLAFATLELLDPGTTVLVLYPQSRVRALATNTLILGPLAVDSGISAGITVGNLSNLNYPTSPVKAVLSFYSVAEDLTLLKQEAVMIEPSQTATLSMSGLAFNGEIIGTVSFDSSAALTVSSLQVFDITTGTTRVALYPVDPIYPNNPVFPNNPIFPQP